MDNKKHDIYEIIIIGSGLAGSEAAFITANYGLKTLIINISMDNPSILKYSPKFGGGHNEVLLNKICSMGGFLKNAIYKNRIAQKKEEGENNNYLNIVDKRKFSLFYKYCLENQKNLQTRQGLVTKIGIYDSKEGYKYKIILNDGSIFLTRAIIISVGTFLNSTVFWGKNEIDSGRDGEINSKILYESLKNIGFVFKKEKVFISPRIDRRTINLQKIKKIKSEENKNIKFFEVPENSEGYIDNISINMEKYYCFKTKISKAELLENICRVSKNYKTDKAKKILNTKIIQSKIQDSGKDEFGIEMFSEGLNTMQLYVNEFNFPLSDEEQNLILNKFYGMENAAIIRPGYCIEYEGLKQELLKKNLESSIHENIYFAGEVNGLQQYESIALQGITAGINAAKKILFKK
jgi:tRNA uridine 5-carboxymethylaminomethyl modification enzyme